MQVNYTTKLRVCSAAKYLHPEWNHGWEVEGSDSSGDAFVAEESSGKTSLKNALAWKCSLAGE